MQQAKGNWKLGTLPYSLGKDRVAQKEIGKCP